MVSRFKLLLEAVEKFGVKFKEVEPPIKLLSKDIFKSQDYLEVEAKDIEIISKDSEFLIVTEDGKILRTTLYIPIDTSSSKQRHSSKKIKSLHKYHIYRCGSVPKDIKSGENKWYQSIRKDGKFIYTFSVKTKNVETFQDQRLNICSNCLGVFEKENHQKTLFSNTPYMKEFNLEKFLSTEPFQELYENGIDIEKDYDFVFGDGTLGLENIDFAHHSIPKEEIEKRLKSKSKYVKDWHNISLAYRKVKSWTCEECGWKPKSENEKRYLHSHHINKDTQNNSDQNLKALCIECHSKQPNHGHMKRLPDLKEFINAKNKYSL